MLLILFYFCAESSIQSKAKGSKKRPYMITGVEEKIVLKAYSENSGWDEILNTIQERLSQPMAGNSLRNESIREYYRSTPRESSIKRIRQIVSQNLQKAKQLPATTTSSSEAATSQTIVNNRMRYSKKCSPKQRKSAKFEQAACHDEDTEDSADTDTDLPEKAIPTPPEPPKQDKPKKKKPSKKRQRAGEEANKAHTQMCGKAVKLMSKLERILNKFDSNSIDDD